MGLLDGCQVMIFSKRKNVMNKWCGGHGARFYPGLLRAWRAW